MDPYDRDALAPFEPVEYDVYMIVSSDLTIPVPGGEMPAYLARPSNDVAAPAVIVLEGVYGFDRELRRITDLVASTGYVGLAIDYFHRTHPRLEEPFTEEGRRRGEDAARSVKADGACADVAAARDWLNDQPFVKRNQVATWGFGFGGTVAFVTATLPGIDAAIVFYGQSITSPLGDGTVPLQLAKELRAPLLLVYGGADERISEHDVTQIEETLHGYNKPFQIQRYPSVGHSFFRQDYGTTALREAADAWDLVQSFVKAHLK